MGIDVTIETQSRKLIDRIQLSSNGIPALYTLIKLINNISRELKANLRVCILFEYEIGDEKWVAKNTFILLLFTETTKK